MKYIDKIDWTKVTEPILAVTLTNLGERYNPKFQVHYLKNRSIFDKGIFDAAKIIELADKFNYNIPNYFAIEYVANGDMATNRNIIELLPYKLASNFIGLLMTITGITTKRIHKLI